MLSVWCYFSTLLQVLEQMHIRGIDVLNAGAKRRGWELGLRKKIVENEQKIFAMILIVVSVVVLGLAVVTGGVRGNEKDSISAIEDSSTVSEVQNSFWILLVFVVLGSGVYITHWFIEVMVDNSHNLEFSLSPTPVPVATQRASSRTESIHTVNTEAETEAEAKGGGSNSGNGSIPGRLNMLSVEILPLQRLQTSLSTSNIPDYVASSKQEYSNEKERTCSSFELDQLTDSLASDSLPSSVSISVLATEQETPLYENYWLPIRLKKSWHLIIPSTRRLIVRSIVLVCLLVMVCSLILSAVILGMLMKKGKPYATDDNNKYICAVLVSTGFLTINVTQLMRSIKGYRNFTFKEKEKKENKASKGRSSRPGYAKRFSRTRDGSRSQQLVKKSFKNVRMLSVPHLA